MTVKDAMGLVVGAWDDVGRDGKKTIHNCFRHCKIRTEIDAERIEEGSLFDQEARTDLETLNGRLSYQSPMSTEVLLNIPNEEVDDFYEEDEEEEEEGLVRRRRLHDSEQPESGSEDDSIEAPVVPICEASAMLESLELFFQQQDGDHASNLAFLRKTADTVHSIRAHSLRQSRIQDLFKSDKGKQKQKAATLDSSPSRFTQSSSSSSTASSSLSSERYTFRFTSSSSSSSSSTSSSSPFTLSPSTTSSSKASSSKASTNASSESSSSSLLRTYVVS